MFTAWATATNRIEEGLRLTAERRAGQSPALRLESSSWGWREESFWNFNISFKGNRQRALERSLDHRCGVRFAVLGPLALVVRLQGVIVPFHRENITLQSPYSAISLTELLE